MVPRFRLAALSENAAADPPVAEPIPLHRHHHRLALVDKVLVPSVAASLRVGAAFAVYFARTDWLCVVKLGQHRVLPAAPAPSPALCFFKNHKQWVLDHLVRRPARHVDHVRSVAYNIRICTDATGYLFAEKVALLQCKVLHIGELGGTPL